MSDTQASNSAPPGTIAHRAIAHLRAFPQGTELSTSAIAHELGHPVSYFGKYLAAAAAAGLLSFRKEAGFSFWRLGPNIDRTQAPTRPSKFEEEASRVRDVSALAVPSVFAYAEQRSAAPFSVSLSTDGRLIAERHGRVIAEFTDVERRVLIQAASVGVTPC